MIGRIDLIDWSDADFKERLLCNIFSTYLKFVSHDEAITVLLTLLVNTIEQDEIDTIIEEITDMKKR
jgi:hypothetical protein